MYVFEAIAAGVPVIEPASGVFLEWLDGVPGAFLYRPNTPEQLAQAAFPLLSEPVHAHRLGLEARRYAASKFDITESAGRLAEVCRLAKDTAGSGE
jgi:glycosyltransferase involved in cell wall biosynthesis